MTATNLTNPSQLPPVNPNVATGMTQGAIQAQIEKNRAAIGQQVANIPQQIQQYSPTTDSMVGALQANRAQKLQELFAHDSNLAQVYFPVQNAPGPSTGEVTMPTNNQAVMDPTIGQRASTGQVVSTAKELSDIDTQLAQRKDYLSNERSKILDSIRLLLESHASDTRDLQAESDINREKAANILDVLKTSGGDVTPEMANLLGDPSLAGKHFQTPSERFSIENPVGRKNAQIQNIINDIAINRMTLPQIIAKYRASGLTGDEIVAAADAAGNQIGIGPHKETTQQLRSLGLSDYNPPKGTQLTTQDINNVSNSSNLLNIIDDTINRLKNVKDSDMGPGKGNVNNMLFKIGAGGVLPEDLRVIGQNLLQMQGMGDRSLMGGRLIRDLVTMFGPSFPNLNYTKAQNLSNLVNIRNKVLNQLNIDAKNKYYQGINDIPGFEQLDTTKYIVVQDKKSGQVGRIPEGEFNSNLYKKL